MGEVASLNCAGGITMVWVVDCLSGCSQAHFFKKSVNLAIPSNIAELCDLDEVIAVNVKDLDSFDEFLLSVSVIPTILLFIFPNLASLL